MTNEELEIREERQERDMMKEGKKEKRSRIG